MSEKNDFHNDNVVLDIHDRPTVGHWVGLSLQHLFTMFGATVLVPILVGIDPGIALVSSGLGTLVYLVTTKGKIPAYLGSSFAFIAADMALAGIESKIPVDEVIDAMYQVGSSLPTAFRETAEGGLAATPTGRRLQREIFGE